MSRHEDYGTQLIKVLRCGDCRRSLYLDRAWEQVCTWDFDERSELNHQ
jgi:hypothetical protein